MGHAVLNDQIGQVSTLQHRSVRWLLERAARAFRTGTTRRSDCSIATLSPRPSRAGDGRERAKWVPERARADSVAADEQGSRVVAGEARREHGRKGGRVGHVKLWQPAR